MKKFILKFILFSLPLLLFVMIVNYFGDYSNIFVSDYENNIASNLLKGFNVTNVSNYDERLLQKIVIEKSKKFPEVLVIGSSRQMLINSSFFKGKSFYNNSVSGATLQDISAILYMYEKKHCYPSKIIIGLDPWTLNAFNLDTRWETLALEYSNFFHIPLQNEISKNYFNKLTQLVSPSYFNSSLNALLFLDKKPHVTKNIKNEKLTKIFDGSICYDNNFRNSTIKEVDKRVDDYLKDKIYNIENFIKLDEIKKNQLIFLFKYLSKKHIKVDLVLSPYHPKVYNFIANKDKYLNVIKSEKYYNELAKKYGITVIGSFNPNDKTKFEAFDFYDGMHLNENGIKKLFRIPNN